MFNDWIILLLLNGKINQLNPKGTGLSVGLNAQVYLQHV